LLPKALFVDTFATNEQSSQKRDNQGKWRKMFANCKQTSQFITNCHISKKLINVTYATFCFMLDTLLTPKCELCFQNNEKMGNTVVAR
jgi:hypothetical protein